MPNFSVPNQINPGDSLDANKAMANWNQVVNDLNGAKIDATNTAASFAKDVVEPAFSGYKLVRTNSGIITSVTAGTWVLIADGATGVLTGSSTSEGIFAFDPADFTAGSRATKLRLTATYASGAAQSGQTVVVGLYPVSSISSTIVTLGAVTAGSTISFANPAANSITTSNSGDFTAPAAGPFVVALTSTGTITGTGSAFVSTRLQVRQV